MDNKRSFSILLFYLTGLLFKLRILNELCKRKKKSYTCTEIVFLTNFMIKIPYLFL